MTESFDILIPGAKGSGERLQVVAPWDLKPICEVPIASGDDVERALATAHNIYTNKDRWLSKPKRIDILQKTAELMEEQADFLAIEAAREGGKPLPDSKAEVARAIDGVKNCVEVLRTDSGREIPMGLNAASMHRLAFTRKEPIGVVVALSAFNHPLNLAVHQVCPGVAAGCPVIIKPAEDTPLSCFRLVKIMIEAGLPEDYVQSCVLADNELTGKMISDPRVSFLSFIGSGKVGWMLRSKLPPGARCALEHGGVAPVIIDDTADLDDTLPLIAKGGFYHAGQVCVSVQKVFAPKSKASEVAERLAALAEGMTLGDPTLDSTQVGPLIRPREVERVSQWIDSAIKEGATKITGGKVHSDTAYECTVLLDPSSSSQVTNSEIFGPLVCVYGYEDVDQVIQQVNSLPYAFQASVLSQNLDFTLHCTQRIDAATIMVNDHTAFRVDWMPFAGLKESGYGIGGIPYTFEDMQIEKQIVIRSKSL
ncbi:MAG: aldehyde dehydrogenase family protein [Pseudomonadota bacterium]